MFKKNVSYLVLSSFLLMDAVSCMEPEDKGPSSPPRSPRVLRNPTEPSVNPASSSSSQSDPLILDPQERLKAISTLPWGERSQPYAELALKEDIPMALRRKALSFIYSTNSIDEVTKEELKSLRTTFLNDETLPFKDRFLPGSYEEAPPVATLLSLTKALESADNESYSEWNIRTLTQFLMSYDRTEHQQEIETCFFKQPALFLDRSTYEKWLSTTLEMNDESKRTSVLQKLREVMQSTKDVNKVAAATKFVLQYSQDAGDKEIALGAFFNVTTQQTASHSKMPREQSFIQKLDISNACKSLLPHAPKDKTTLLKTLSEDMLQQVEEEISAIVDPQERLRAIFMLPWDERNRLFAELALKDDIPIALRQEVLHYIFLTDSLDEATRRRLGNLRTAFLNDETLSFKERFAFLRSSGAPPVATLLSLARALDSEEDVSYSECLIQLLMSYDRTESQEGIERCFFKQPALFLKVNTYEEWLRTTLETSDESKRASILQKLREVMQSTEIVTNIVYIAKFILKHSQNAGDQETTLEAFFNIATRQTASHSEMPREQSFRRLDISDACKALLPHVPEDKATLLRTLSKDILQQICTGISEIIDPQERLQAIAALPWDEQGRKLRDQLYAELALKEDTPSDLRPEALLSIFSTDSLDEITRKSLRNLKATIFNDEKLSLMNRLAFLPSPIEEAPPVTTLLSLMRTLEVEKRDSSDSDDDEIYDDNGRSYKYTLYHFLAECPDLKVQQRLENYYFNHPLAIAFYLKEWLDDFYKKGEENQKTLILQKMQEAMQQATDMTFDIIAAAKFLLIHSQDHEVAIQTLWKLVEKQTSKGSEGSEGEREYERKNKLITVCKILLKYAPTSPVRESIFSRLFTEAEQEISPRALVLLLTQQNPSVTIRARELAEQRLHQNNLGYTLDLFFNLEEEDIELDLRHKIQEKLKPELNDSTDQHILLRLAPSRLAPVFLRATDESLSQKAFNYLKQYLTDNDYPDNAETTVYQIIEAVGVDHPWAQEVIKIGIGIEQIDHPSSAIRGHRQLLKKIKEPVIHHPSSTRLDDGRGVAFDIQTLQAPRSLSHLLPVQHSKFMDLAEGLREEVQRNPEAKAHFSTISKKYSVESLVNKANGPYFKNLLDSEARQGVISLISFKLRRLITDIIALKTETQTITEPSPSSSSMVTDTSTAPFQSGLSPASTAIAQLLVNVMKFHTYKDDGTDHTSRSLWNEPIISEEALQEERLIATARDHIMEDLRQLREGLLNGEGPIVKELLFGTKENHNRKVDDSPQQGEYLGNLLGGELGSFLEGQSASYDPHGGWVEEKLRSYTKQQVLDTLHRHFKPENVIERYLEQFNKEGRKGRLTNLISTLMGEEMFVMTPEGRMPNGKYSTFDPNTEFVLGYTPLLVAEVLLRLNILSEVQTPSIAIGVPSSSFSMAAPSSSKPSSEDSVGGP